MKRARPDYISHSKEYGPALGWNPDRRCPQRCEYRGEHQPGEAHFEYRVNGDKSRPVPMLWLLKR